MRAWLALTSMIGLPILLMSLRDLMTGRDSVRGDLWVGIIVPPALVLCGTLMSKFGRLLSRGEERYFLQYVQETLAARIEEPTHSL
jgi:hypothetical protein